VLTKRLGQPDTVIREQAPYRRRTREVRWHRRG
jgi:hypothetical protein